MSESIGETFLLIKKENERLKEENNSLKNKVTSLEEENRLLVQKLENAQNHYIVK